MKYLLPLLGLLLWAGVAWGEEDPCKGVECGKNASCKVWNVKMADEDVALKEGRCGCNEGYSWSVDGEGDCVASAQGSSSGSDEDHLSCEKWHEDPDLNEKVSLCTESTTPVKSKNWAQRAIAYGFVFTSIIQPLGFTADGARAFAGGIDGGGPDWGYQWPFLVLPTAIILLVSPPIIAAGAASARKNTRVWGFPGAREAGWILYGLSAAMCIPFTTITLLPWIWPEREANGLPIGLMTGMTVLGALSGMLFTIDGMGSLKQLEALQDEQTPGESSTMTAYPFLAPVADGAVAGIGGTF